LDDDHFGIRYENKNSVMPIDETTREENRGFKIIHDATDLTSAYSNRFYNDIDTGF
jgi:hypothetical protein